MPLERIGDTETVTLVANTVSTVTLDGNYSSVIIVKHGDSAAAWVGMDGDVPTVAGAGCIPLLPGSGERQITSEGQAATVAKVISTGTPVITVMGVS